MFVSSIEPAQMTTYARPFKQQSNQWHWTKWPYVRYFQQGHSPLVFTLPCFAAASCRADWMWALTSEGVVVKPNCWEYKPISYLVLDLAWHILSNLEDVVFLTKKVACWNAKHHFSFFTKIKGFILKIFFNIIFNNFNLAQCALLGEIRKWCDIIRSHPK